MSSTVLPAEMKIKCETTDGLEVFYYYYYYYLFLCLPDDANCSKYEGDVGVMV